MLGNDEFEVWFRLLETPGVGRQQARKLLAACGSPEAVFRTPRGTLNRLVGEGLAQALLTTPPEWTARLQTAVSWLQGGSQRHALALGDSDYPAALQQSADPPLLLYVLGRPETLSMRSLAVVGSRHATAQGLDNARAFARELSNQGLLVCSGLAQGIDAAAHEGALEASDVGAAGTLAVVGTGLDRVYPRQHEGLARRIAQAGALVSEYAPGTPALPEHFPQRNRILAGLSVGTLVVEAALRSGSLITARLAAEAGREVFAIPGSIHSPQSKGCHALIKQGAKLVESAQDLQEELGLLGSVLSPHREPRPPNTAALADEADAADGGDTADGAGALLRALGEDPVTLDALVARTGQSASTLTVSLLALEFEGQVARLPGGLYQRRHSG